jgi:CheY-like chemotaxis protein
VDILHQIRRDQNLANVPVIVTTADSLLADSIQGQAEEILIKPVDFTRLREAVLRLCPGSGQNESQGQKRS